MSGAPYGALLSDFDCVIHRCVAKKSRIVEKRLVQVCKFGLAGLKAYHST